jgi:hypothetical protein
MTTLRSALEAEPAGLPERVGPDLALFERRDEHAVGTSAQEPLQAVARRDRRRPSPTRRRHRAVTHHCACRNAAHRNPRHRRRTGDRLAIDNELGDLVLARGRDDPREALGPVIGVAGDQPDTITTPFDAEATTVVFDLLKPVRSTGDFGTTCRNAKIKRLNIRENQFEIPDSQAAGRAAEIVLMSLHIIQDT